MVAPGRSARSAATPCARCRSDLTLRDAVKRSRGLAAGDLKAEKKLGLRVHGRAGQKCPVCGDTVREVSFRSDAQGRGEAIEGARRRRPQGGKEARAACTWSRRAEVPGLRRHRARGVVPI